MTASSGLFLTKTVSILGLSWALFIFFHSDLSDVCGQVVRRRPVPVALGLPRSLS